MPPLIAIFISGRGSNMQALVAHARTYPYENAPYRIGLVVSNNPDAPGLKWADNHNLPIINIDHKPFGKDRQAHETLINQALDLAQIDFIALAGYMRVLSPAFCTQWQGKMINIHPSLLPLYKGLDTHKRALAAGDQIHGCTAHWVSSGVDEGPIIDQEIVPILSHDTETTLAERVLEAEHKLYPRALEKALKLSFPS